MTLCLSTNEEQRKQAQVLEACSRVPPLWPLQNFVAVNPFLGLSGMHFTEADELLGKVTHRHILMDASYYLDRIGRGHIHAADIRAALEQEGQLDAPAHPVSWLTEQLKSVGESEQLLTVADWLDRRDASGWSAFVVDEISKWCSSYFDNGQSSWKAPFEGLSLYSAWKQAAEVDANPELFGLPDFRRYVSELPYSEEAAIGEALELLDVPASLTADFLHRQLMSVAGWSAFAAYKDREGSGRQLVRQLLAIRLAYDCALFVRNPQWRCRTVAVKTAGGPLRARYIAQLAAEHAFRSQLLNNLKSSPVAIKSTSRKMLQAIFCIDVRSEVYRRALESQGPGIETIGFAGFFGMPIGLGSAALCPVLLAPRHELQREESCSAMGRAVGGAATVWNSLRNSATACFSAVEVAGAWSAISLLRQSVPKSRADEASEAFSWSIPLDSQVDLAAGAMKNMSIDTASLAPVVLVCGHGSSTENNPYASSLDCGACGGHKGDVNARFAAALMNSPAVRQGLAERGIEIPEDTVFVPGLHNTTTDEVTLWGMSQVSDYWRQSIRIWLDAASAQARRERNSPGTGLTLPTPENRLRREVERRSTDWSEVRPEWGLAGNAAFVAAPRSRTRALNLQGRVFLHDYDSAADPDASVLQLILTAPVVVASWINLQYYASTVDNHLFGSGNKVLHNVVGRFGVWEGNGGDLRTGLPLQSLHDGSRWMHEPLRLQVFIEAPRERIDKVLKANPSVRELVDNGWIHLTCLDGGHYGELPVNLARGLQTASLHAAETR